MNDTVATPSLPKLLREVRKSISKDDYLQAEGLYEQILEFPEMADNLDIRIRYASCAEKNGNHDKADGVYRMVMESYRKSGDESAAQALEKHLADIAKEISHAGEVVDVINVSDAISDAELMRELCAMGELSILHPGDVLCRTGDFPDMLWLLQKGSMTVYMPDYEEPDSIESMEGHLTLVGELGFFTSQRRSADVIAASVVEIYAVKSDDIMARKRVDPTFRAAMRRLLLERWAEPVLTRHSVFERVNDIDRMRIMFCFNRVTLGPGQTLIEAGEEHPYAYMLQSGCMFFMHSPNGPDDSAADGDGSEMTSIFPGDMIHLGGLIQGYDSKYRVVTGTPVQLLRLSQTDFEPFTFRRPWIIQAIRRFSLRPAHLQVMKPDDAYLWKANRHVKLT